MVVVGYRSIDEYGLNGLQWITIISVRYNSTYLFKKLSEFVESPKLVNGSLKPSLNIVTMPLTSRRDCSCLFVRNEFPLNEQLLLLLLCKIARNESYILNFNP